VAIKKVKRNRRNFMMVKQEIDVLKALGQHDRICELIEVLYLGGDADTTGPNRIGEVYLIYTPLATTRFHDLILSSMEDQDRVIILKQCIEGIEYIHSKHLMHRDIKPGNLAVSSRTPPKAIILDFGSATWERSSMDHMVGTIPYLAPEIMELKKGRARQPYDNSVDMWGLGVSGYQLLCQKERIWSEVTRQAYNGIQAGLIVAMKERPALRPVIQLLQRMTSWSPLARESAADALASDAFKKPNE